MKKPRSVLFTHNRSRMVKQTFSLAILV